MDRGDGGPGDGRKPHRPGLATITARVPSELKYLVICYRNASKMPSFNYALQRLLETHPAIAQLAAELYTEAERVTGRSSENEIQG